MKNGAQISDKEKRSLIETILEEYIKTSDYSLFTLCGKCGISDRTFYNWIPNFPDLKKKYNKAKIIHNNLYKGLLKSTAREGLMKRVQGYRYQETIKEANSKPLLNKEGKVIGKKIVSEHVKISDKEAPPDVGAIRFALSNIDKENFKEKQTIDGEIGNSNVSTEKLSFEELYFLKYGYKPNSEIYDDPSFQKPENKNEIDKSKEKQEINESSSSSE